ncbi:MAG: GNAT family N-acetyltransferase, partial [Spirochaetales bacterium]|nr:GNAT family N-acetyltransferase [Spirochaetales bacterium]
MQAHERKGMPETGIFQDNRIPAGGVDLNPDTEQTLALQMAPNWCKRIKKMEKQKSTIVKARPDHIAEACDIAVDAWTPIRDVFRDEIGDELYAAFYSNWQDEKRQTVTRELLANNGYVAMLDGRVVGFISYTVDRVNKVGTIGTNAVHRAYRGQGIGGQLYQHVFDCLKAEGVSFVKVVTGLDEGHAPARRAYEKAGFTANLKSICYYKKL